MVKIDISKTFQTVRGFGVTLPVTVVNSKVYTRPFLESLLKDLGCSIIRTMFPTQKDATPDPERLKVQSADLNFMRGLRPDLKVIASINNPPESMQGSDGRLRPDARGSFGEYLFNLCETFEKNGCPIYGMGFQNAAFRLYDVDNYCQMSAVLGNLRKKVKLFGTEDNFQSLPLMKGAISATDILAVQGYIDTSWGAINAVRSSNLQATLDDVFNAVYTDFHKQFGSLGKEAWVIESGYDHMGWKSLPMEYNREVSVRDLDFCVINSTDALDLAQKINRAFTLGNFSAYVYGMASTVSFGEGGEYNPDMALCDNGLKGAKFQSAKHFFKYVLPGMVRVGADSDSLEISAFKSDKAVVVVLINNKNFIVADQINFNSTKFGHFTSYTSVVNEHHYQETGNVIGDSMKLLMLPNSIVTLILEE